MGNNPLKYIDPKGLDVWIEGGSGDEPTLHQSINVGNPNGSYESYSFAWNGNWLQGEVYIDEKHGGPIDAYKQTTPQQDADFLKQLNAQKGNKGTYGYDNTCTTWSQDQFKNAPGTEITPPNRDPAPKIIVGPSSTTTQTGVTSGATR